jgi:prophage regulatory protein
LEVREKSKRLLAWSELRKRIPYTRQHIGRLERDDQFPRRIQLGGSRVAWLEAEVDAWIAARVAERDKAA